ncbi:MAG: FHA domain-containing protein [Anaerolineae bacterium]
MNRVGVLICENCGTSLVAAAATILGTQKFDKNPIVPASAAVITTVPEPKLDTAEVNALKSAGTDGFDETMILRLEVEGSPTPILVYPREETSLGRRDPAGGTMPDVDLTSYAAYRMGVSRRHAILKLKDSRLQLVDLGSSNGTMLNGVKLPPHQPRTLHDGDTIMLGKMNLRVIYQSSARR